MRARALAVFVAGIAAGIVILLTIQSMSSFDKPELDPRAKSEVVEAAELEGQATKVEVGIENDSASATSEPESPPEQSVEKTPVEEPVEINSSPAARAGRMDLHAFLTEAGLIPAAVDATDAEWKAMRELIAGEQQRIAELLELQAKRTREIIAERKEYGRFEPLPPDGTTPPSPPGLITNSVVVLEDGSWAYTFILPGDDFELDQLIEERERLVRESAQKLKRFLDSR